MKRNAVVLWRGTHSPCPYLEPASFYHIGPYTSTPVGLV